MKNLKIRKFIYLFLVIFASTLATHGQNITTTHVENNMLPDTFLNRYFAGEGVTLHNCKFNWSSAAIQGLQVGTFTNTNPSFPFRSGILLTTGNIDFAQGPNTGSPASDPVPQTADHIDYDLQPLATASIYSTSVLEFNFYTGRNEFTNKASFNYIFASEEYPTFVCSSYNDVFAFFLTGPDPDNCGRDTTVNIAFIPTGGENFIPVTINTVNGGGHEQEGCPSNSAFFRVNPSNGPIEYNGYTARSDNGQDVGLTASSMLCPCSEYKIKISIANIGDNNYDSGVFLETGSFKMPKKLSIADSITNNRDTLIKNCTESNLRIKYGEPLDANMKIILYSDGGTAQQEDFHVLRYRSNNQIDTLHHGDEFYLYEGDTIIDLKLQVAESAQFEPNEVKNVQLVFKSILCADFNYLNNTSEELTELAQYDTLRYFMIDNNRFILVSDSSNRDSIFYCDRCEHVEVPIIGGTEPLIYKWDHEGLLNSPHSRESDCNLTENTTFEIIVSDRWGCLVDTCYHTILITSTPVLEGHYHITPHIICVPEEVEFRSTATPASTHKWIIYNDNMSDTISGNPQTYTFTNPGKYSILYRAYEAEVCDASINLVNYINAGMQPTALFTFDPAEAEIGQEVLFTNESEGLNIHYQWSFGDGSNSAEENPTHVYYSENSENYNVILTVSDDADCKDIYIQAVPVVDNHVLFVPNSFTPNNDELNDIFKPVVACVAKYQITIYDKNGGIVFVTDNPEIGWDGTTSNGIECPSGIYNYIIHYIRFNNLKQELIKTGSINLIR